MHTINTTMGRRQVVAVGTEQVAAEVALSLASAVSTSAPTGSSAGNSSLPVPAAGRGGIPAFGSWREAWPGSALAPESGLVAVQSHVPAAGSVRPAQPVLLALLAAVP